MHTDHPRRRRAWLPALTACMVAAGLAVGCGSSSDDSTDSATAASSGSSGGTIKVGVLHSLSGTMAISEVSVKDSELLAIKEINAAGGVLGKKVDPVIEDGASDWPTFAEKAQKLISQDKVAATFGGWTSASRKAMLPVFEGNKALLFYPVQYEGLEASPYIFYTGATTNQQIIPALEYLRRRRAPRSSSWSAATTSSRARPTRRSRPRPRPTGWRSSARSTPRSAHTEFSTIVNKVKSSAQADAVFNTLNGDSNVAFFKQLKGAGLPADKIPIVSVSHRRGGGPRHRRRRRSRASSWRGTTTRPPPGAANEKFVEAYKAEYGDDRVTDDPIEAGYVRSTSGPRRSRRPARPTSRRSRRPPRG